MYSMNNPRITVLMPVYNSERFLRESIESILDQTFQDFEFLIINDGSTDHSVDIIKSYKDSRIRLVHNSKNIKLIATLNKGIRLAHGEYIVRMDADDISMPDRLEKQFEYMQNNPDIGICGTWATTIGDNPGLIMKLPSDPQIIKCQLLFHCCIVHPSVIIRKGLLLKYKLKYDEEDLYAEDWALWIKSSFYFNLANIPQVLLKYRLNEGSISKKYRSEQMITENRIITKNIGYFGISINDHNVMIHDKLRRGIISLNNKKEIYEIIEYMNKLIEMNRLTGVCDNNSLQLFLGEMWYNICKARSEEGLISFFTYIKANPFIYSLKNFKNVAIFFLKSLFNNK